MKKLIFACLISLFACAQAQAGFISQVTGADMVGMEVTVTFENNTTETLVWDVFTQDASVPFLEGYSGGVSGNGWSVIQAGDTISEYVNSPLGLWTITNSSDQGIISIFFNGLAGNVVFDILFGDASANGSEEGRPFLSASGNINASFGSNYMDELYGTMLLSNNGGLIVAEGARELFIVDTDIITVDADVSAPTTLGISLFALCGLILARVYRQQ